MNATLNVKSYAEDSHVRLDEWEVVSCIGECVKPRGSSLLFKNMKIVLGLLAVGAAGTVVADEARWNYSATTGATTYENAASWSDAANWTDGYVKVPNSTATDVSFTNADAFAALTVRIPEEGVSVKKLSFKSTSQTVHFFGGPIDLDTMENANANGFTFFGNVHFRDKGMVGYASQTYCGRVSGTVQGAQNNSTYRWTSGSIGSMPRHRLDFGATSEDWSENIYNPCPTNGMQSGSGGGKFVYAPRGTDAPITVENCSLRNGSKFVTLPSGYKARTTLPVGTAVTGSGLAEGTHLRFILSDTLVELTEAWTGSDTDAGSITFAAFSPKVYQRMCMFDCWAGGPQKLLIGKWREKDVFRFTLDNLQSQSGTAADANSFRLDVPESTMIPATLVLVDTGSLNSRFVAANAHVEFAADGSRGLNATCRTMHDNANSCLRVTCPEGVDSTIGQFTNFVGTLKKDGPAKLTVGVTGLANHILKVNEGEFVWTNLNTTAERDTQSLDTLEIASGATFRIAAGCRLTVKALTASSGAKIVGDGTVCLPGADAVPAGVIDPSVTVGFAGTADGVITGEIVPQVVGDPAFWVDVQAVGSIENADGRFRWNDCRKTSDADGYMYATNRWAAPTLTNVKIVTYNGQGPYGNDGMTTFEHDCVRIPPKPATLADCAALFWNRKLAGIRSVFLVMSATDGGGCVLGDEEKLGDFCRGNTYDAALFYHPNGSSEFSPPAVHNAPIYLNGVRRDSSLVLGTGWRPFLLEVHPTYDGGAADNFGFQTANRLDLCGGQRIFECLIYTNELSRMEQAQVADYLTRKWFKAGYNGETLTEAKGDLVDVAKLEVASGTVAVKSVTGAAFSKSGDGELAVSEFAGGTDLTVADGVMTINSTCVPTIDDLRNDSGVHLHLDANDLSTSTKVAIDGKGECVQQWKSIRGTALNTATAFSTNCPALKTTSGSARLKDGMNYVDLGAFHSCSAAADGYGDKNASFGETFYFPRVDNVRSAFFIFKGGNVLLGWNHGLQNYHGAGLMRGKSSANNGNASDALISDVAGSSKSFANTYPYATHVQVNGTEVNPTNTGLDDDFNVISLRTYIDPIISSALGCIHYNNMFGGQQLGEVILYTNVISRAETLKVEAYLKNKWCRGGASAGFRPAVAGKVVVAEGATLNVVGGVPLTATGLGGGGTVAGDVTLQDNAELTVVITDGVPSSQTIDGTLTLPAHGTIKVVGDFAGLALGEFDVFKSASIHASTDLSGWSRNFAQALHPEKRNVSFKAVEGAIRMKVIKPGVTIVFR